MHVLARMGNAMSGGRENPHTSFTGCTDMSETMSAPRNGMPLRVSSFFVIEKQGMPCADWITASAMREYAHVSGNIEYRLMVNIVARQVFRALTVVKKIIEYLFKQFSGVFIALLAHGASGS